MACRILMGVTVKCGQWREFVTALDRLNQHERAVGVSGVRFWAAQSGQAGRVILDAEYPSLAAMEKDLERLRYDVKHQELLGNLTRHTIDGSNERTILQEVDIARYGGAKG